MGAEIETELWPDVLGVYCCDYKLINLKHHTRIISQFLWVGSPGTAWLGPLLRVPQVVVNTAGLHSHLELGVLFQAH